MGEIGEGISIIFRGRIVNGYANIFYAWEIIS